jgi:uncharacterized protein (TIGR00369 family)
MSGAPTTFVPPDPAWREKVEREFAAQSAMRLIGARIARLEPGVVDIELPAREDLRQQHGFIHGGVTTMIADSAAGFAGYSLMPAGSQVLTVEFKVNLLAPARGDRLLACARVIKPGRTLVICDIDVFAFDGERKAAVLKGLETLISLQNRAA